MGGQSQRAVRPQGVEGSQGTDRACRQRRTTARTWPVVSWPACHAFLASTVTDVGWPLLAFTLYEGLICAFLRLRGGVTAAALAHGLAIFLLAGALV